MSKAAYSLYMETKGQTHPHLLAQTLADKYVAAHATILFYQKQTRVLCTHLILWLVFYLSACQSKMKEQMDQ